MAIFKCKMCGGNLEVQPGTSVGTCDSCGSVMTLPNLNDERKVNLYDRANHFRRLNDYDRAAAIYEQILLDDTDDAEAYWSLVLCRFGVEYVEDPTSGERIPTCNRAQTESIYQDSDYKMAIEKADEQARTVYEKEAAAIDEIQKGILAISSKEQPFDVFICYKEADERGERTVDSVLAQELYQQLTQEGLRVFFARITLEEKLGSAYEPYIFAALTSAKVMIVVGTKPEHLNAVWVKNEWSRYLRLMNQGEKKTMIPAYRDMDPYDLPEAFAHLQALDMSKIGFSQDLIRGIKKILSAAPEEDKAGNRQAVLKDNLLRLGEQAVEAKNWREAIEQAGKALEIDPECARAWLIKMLAVPIQAEKERYEVMRIREVEMCGRNAVQYTGNEKRQEVEKQAEQAVEQMTQNYVEAAMAELRIGAANINALLEAAALAREIGQEMPYTKNMRRIVEPLYYEIQRRVNALSEMAEWQNISRQCSEIRSRIYDLRQKLSEFEQREKEEEKKRQKETAERNAKSYAEFWSAREELKKELTSECKRLERLKEEAKGEEKSFINNQISRLARILNFKNRTSGTFSEEEKKILDGRDGWEQERQNMRLQIQETCKELRAKIQQQEQIIQENKALIGKRAQIRRAAEAELEELKLKLGRIENRYI